MRWQLQLLLHAFDDGWSHRLESLTAVLQGVTETEAAWQHTCYRADEGQPGMPPPGTILWQIAHLEHSARDYNDLLLNRRVSIQRQTPAPAVTNFPDGSVGIYSLSPDKAGEEKLFVRAPVGELSAYPRDITVTAGSCCSGAVRRLRRSRGDSVAGRQV